MKCQRVEFVHCETWLLPEGPLTVRRVRHTQLLYDGSAEPS